MTGLARQAHFRSMIALVGRMEDDARRLTAAIGLLMDDSRRADAFDTLYASSWSIDLLWRTIASSPEGTS